MAKLLSSTGKSTAEITPDGVSLIMRSVKNPDSAVWWPMKDKEALLNFIRINIGGDCEN